MFTSTTYLPSLVQIRSAVKKCKKCQILRQTQNPDPDPDPKKAEYNPDASPNQGNIVPKFGSNPSNRLGGVTFCMYQTFCVIRYGSKVRAQPRCPPLIEGKDFLQDPFQSITSQFTASVPVSSQLRTHSLKTSGALLL